MENLRVLTLNIWGRQGPWEERLKVIRRGLEALSPDVVGLQEVLHHASIGPNQAEQIADGLGYRTAFGAAWELGGGLHFGNALLSRFPIAWQNVWPLPAGSPGADRDEPRALLGAELEAPCGRVPVFVTHLNWKLDHASFRVLQVEAIADRIAEQAQPPGFPPILMGDFNAEPESDEIRFLRGHHVLNGKSVYFADCFAVAGPGGPGHTFSRANRYALLNREPNRRIDYVFVRGPDRQLRGEPLAARVVLDQPMEGVFASDHFGVLADIRAIPRRRS